jgi:hypothetical protein
LSANARAGHSVGPHLILAAAAVAVVVAHLGAVKTFRFTLSAGLVLQHHVRVGVDSTAWRSSFLLTQTRA